MKKRRPSEGEGKLPSGIAGFDEITRGGLPKGRVTVLQGPAGCGKTVFALESLVAGARLGEPGIFVTFEENPDQLKQDARRFDWDLARFDGRGVCFLDGQLSDAILDGGAFDLLGLLAAVGAKAKQIGAARVVFDGIDALLGHLGDPLLVRKEIFRIRAWARSSGLTCLLTAKADALEGAPSPDYDFLQYAADCVVSLRHRVEHGSAIRTLRVAKYRGDAHSSNEFPFTITRSGVEVAPGASAVLHHTVFSERVSSGVDRLDAMLGGGYYRGSSVLISGAPGTSKTSLAVSFADAACRRERPPST